MGKVGEAITKGIGSLILSIVSAILLIILGIIFFGVISWIIQASSEIFLENMASADYVVVAGAILTSGALIAGALEQA